MDLIGSIKQIESKLGRRKPNQAKSKTAPKNNHTDTAQEQSHQAHNNSPSAEDESKLGRNIDTTA